MAEGDHYMGERMPGKIKDMLPLIPDHVVEALDKGVDVPMEAFSSGAAREHLQDRMAARNEPVHAENLIPVARNDPRIAGFGKLDGEHLPRMPARKRVIPAPFQRPRIEIGHHGRTWKLVLASQVREGDIVPDIGRIVSAQERIDYRMRSEIFGSMTLYAGETPPEQGPDGEEVAVGTVIIIEGLSGVRKAFRPGAQLRVFCAEDTSEVVPGT
jgi:hypothetical protein